MERRYNQTSVGDNVKEPIVSFDDALSTSYKERCSIVTELYYLKKVQEGEAFNEIGELRECVSSGNMII